MPELVLSSPPHRHLVPPPWSSCQEISTKWRDYICIQISGTTTTSTEELLSHAPIYYVWALLPLCETQLDMQALGICVWQKIHTHIQQTLSPRHCEAVIIGGGTFDNLFIGNQCFPCIERSVWPSSHDHIWPTWTKGQSMNHNEVTPSRFMPKSVNGHSWQDDLQWNKTYQDLTSCRQNRTDSKRANWFQNVSFNNRKLQQSDYKCFFLILITNDHG